MRIAQLRTGSTDRLPPGIGRGPLTKQLTPVSFSLTILGSGTESRIDASSLPDTRPRLPSVHLYRGTFVHLCSPVHPCSVAGAASFEGAGFASAGVAPVTSPYIPQRFVRERCDLIAADPAAHDQRLLYLVGLHHPSRLVSP